MKKNQIFLLFLILTTISLTKILSQTDEIYIPFQKDNHWGFADTNRNIVVYPRFDEVKNYKNGNFLVKNKTKYGLVNKADEIILKVIYSNIRRFKSGLIEGTNNEERILFTINGKEIIKGSYSRIQPYDRLVHIHTKSGKEGLFLLNERQNRIEKWVLDTVYNEIQIGLNRTPPILSAKKKGEFPIIFEITELFELKKIKQLPNEGVYEDKAIDDYSEDNQEEIWYYYLEESLNDSLISRIKYTQDKSRKSIRDTISHSFHSVKVIQDYQYGLPKALNLKRYGIITTKDKEKGVMNGKGEVIISPKYKIISKKIIPYTKERVVFLCKEKKQWGAIDNEGKTVVSFNHDSLFTYPYLESNIDYGLVSLKNGKYGLVKSRDSIVVKNILDEISQINRSSKFQLKMGISFGLYSLIPSHMKSRLGSKKDSIDRVYLPAIYDKKIQDFDIINGYILGKIYDDEGIFLGFADKKGFYYFD